MNQNVKKMNDDIEIRKLSPGSVFGLCKILECGEAWKQLMAVIPVECVEGNPPKYTGEHMKIIENTGAVQKRPCSEILLDEWGTSSKRRPKLSTLMKFLTKAELYRAAEYVAVELLKVDPPVRPENGPAATVDIPDVATLPLLTPVPSYQANPGHVQSLHQQSSDHNANASTQLLQEDLEDVFRYGTRIQELSYTVLSAATSNFNDNRRLGGGAWGTVYLGHINPNTRVAIKRLRETGVPGDPKEQFQNEIKTLSQLSHPNLLTLCGYSVDGPAPCLVYQFMQNGSLMDQLASQDNNNHLKWKVRLRIAEGAAHGISHLHTALAKPLVHRDIKSANILLDSNYVPKLGDFGLVRLGASGDHSHSIALTTTVFGTSAYMAPEAFRGDVSVKMDIFSYGVVLLELLTGLPPYDEDRDGCDLVSHVTDIDDINSILDRRAGEWDCRIVDELYQLALHCLEEKKKRPNIATVIDKLNPLLML